MNQENQNALQPADAIPQLPEFTGSADNRVIKPHLRIDHGSGQHSKYPGNWIYADGVVTDLLVIFCAVRQFRTFFAATYNENPDAPMTCASWDGQHAFGFGGRIATGEPCERICVQRSGGRELKVCPHAGAEGDEWCRPQDLYLLMVAHKDSNTWMPAFFEARGRAVQPTAKAFDASRVKAMSSLKRRPDGTTYHEAPLYCWAQKATLMKIPHKSGYEPVYGSPQRIEQPDAVFVGNFLASVGKGIWDEDLARAEARARAIGSKDTRPEKTDVDNVPF